MRPWCLGNTTVRSPFRLRDGLVALSASPLQGNLRGQKQEMNFCSLLSEHGIVNLRGDVTYSVGRKWRSALNQLGFLYPAMSSPIPLSELNPLDMITSNGWNLIRADTVPAMQECFLRALAAYYIPSPLEPKFDCSIFSPLRHTLAIMLELEKQTGESRLNFIEMAAVVQLTSSDDNLAVIVANILDFRDRRKNTPLNKKKFDREELTKLAKTVFKPNGQSYEQQTFNDYADTNFRYLKATGLVQSKGRGLSLVPEKHVFVEKLIQDTRLPDSVYSYLVTLCKGATLPTDNKDSALAVLDDLLYQLNKRGIPFDITGKPTETPADIAIIRHQIEGILSERNEEEYATQQADQWEEIAAYMGLIMSRHRGKKTLLNGDEIEVPQSEAPAYFEWVLWRAFLAINSLANKPYDARRFKIDQDFLPVGTAPGNGPDLIFEFDDFVIVVEVTLTDNSRQEAAEGEPVRRHVADLVSHYAAQSGKSVYGLFIANRIDSNTAETFRIGGWFTRTDEKMRLDIIPLTLEQFKVFFEALFMSGRVEVVLIRELLDLCGGLRAAHEAPAWKHEIGQTINHKIVAIMN